MKLWVNLAQRVEARAKGNGVVTLNNDAVLRGERLRQDLLQLNQWFQWPG